MPHESHPASPGPATLRPHWTPARQRIFLAALMETGSVSHAARVAGMSRSSAQRLRTRLTGTPFDRLWTQALRHRAARLADPFDTKLEPERRTPAARPAQG